MKTVAIINQKGGVGKTTTAHHLAVGLSLKGYKVLSVDLDAQGNLSFASGACTGGASSLGLLTGDVSALDAIQKTAHGDTIPSSRSLAGADAFITDTGKEYRLREALESVSDLYDYCVIDTPPALGILTVNALTACAGVIIPVQADIYSLQGVEQLCETMKPVKRYCNPDLTVDGLLLTRYSPRSVLGREIAVLADQIARKIGTRLYNATIRDAVAVKEAQINQQSLYDYAPKAKVTQDYEAFVREFLQER